MLSTNLAVGAASNQPLGCFVAIFLQSLYYAASTIRHTLTWLLRHFSPKTGFQIVSFSPSLGLLCAQNTRQMATRLDLCLFCCSPRRETNHKSAAVELELISNPFWARDFPSPCLRLFGFIFTLTLKEQLATVALFGQHMYYVEHVDDYVQIKMGYY